MATPTVSVTTSISRWHRRYLNAFWWSIFITVIAECASLLTSARDPIEFVLHFILLPTALMSLIMGATEGLLRVLPKGHEYIVTAACSGLSTVIVFVHARIDFIQAVGLLPILFSVFYFRRRILLFAFGLNGALAAAAVLLHPLLRAQTSATEWISLYAILFGATWFALRIMEREVELRKHLEEETRSKERLLMLSRTDALTGLYNHITYHERIEHAYGALECETFPLHLALIDIDNFKSINDTYGHRTGDLVLQRVAQRIKEGMAADDEAFRYGGEEFAMLLFGVSPEEAYRRLERIRTRIADTVHEELGGRPVTVSVGLGTREPGESKESLFEKADALLYKAKREGKNQTAAAAGLRSA
ncbi:GGDEF domain-containing protein [Paenibacillus sp.]|uniref:GGDEF domain-containing protein n=1 Tax=Paenibacillus sp. TaxID=58172 RepID=UPI002D48FBA1|nr:GGDEF domain-containing protein [Paenibacillus sp.]HZG57863.1 GGDEF domain-containing protein [Paenibacillus sp.]